MHGWKKRSAILLVIATLLLTSSRVPALAVVEPVQEGSAPAMIVDFVLVRPLGIVATAIGTVVFVASLPFTAPARNTKEAFKKLVVAPAKFTFYRPLGRTEWKTKTVPKKSE